MAVQLAPRPGSNIYANPRLQEVNRPFARQVIKKMNEVNRVQSQNFNPKQEKQISTLLFVISVALVIFGILAAVLASATGIGAGIGAAGLILAAIAYHMRDKAVEKEGKAGIVEMVHRDASTLRFEDLIRKHDNSGQVVGGQAVALHNF